jgi:hypothetical protein
MFALDNELLQIPGVLSVNRHKEMLSKGRWSIMTTEPHFKKVVKVIKLGLGPWMENYKEFPPPATFPKPSLAFKNRSYEEESEGSNASFDSYLSACSSIYSLNDDTNYNVTPPSTIAAPQAWGGTVSIPTVLDATISTPANSGISQDAFDNVTQDNLKLNRKVDELTTTVQQLLSKMSEMLEAQTAPTRPTPTPTPVLLTRYIEQIIAATTRAVMESYARTLQR